MKSILTKLVGPVLGLSLCLLPAFALAGISLPWATTYNCAEQIQGTSPWVSCDGMASYGTWTSSAGNREQITTAANYPGGGGGRGQRSWNSDGTNHGSGGIRIPFSTSQTEFWMRWYMRYQSGYQWNPLSYDKILYFGPNAGNGIVIDFRGADGVDVWAGAARVYTASPGGWATIHGGATSDGSWHCYEIHIKAGSPTGGTAQWWVDGVLRLDRQNIDMGSSNGWPDVIVGHNQATPNNGGDRSVDFDDIAIRNTGRIGCIGTTPPAAPQNLQLTP